MRELISKAMCPHIQIRNLLSDPHKELVKVPPQRLLTTVLFCLQECPRDNTEVHGSVIYSDCDVSPAIQTCFPLNLRLGFSLVSRSPILRHAWVRTRSSWEGLSPLK